MKFDFTGAELFLDFMEGKSSVAEVMAHPAYRVIASHASFFSNGLTEQDIFLALEGHETRFYGLKNVHSDLPVVHELIKHIRHHQTQWLSIISQEIQRLIPGANLTRITIYPVIGYDAGIGHNNAVCLNLNWKPYLLDPNEFLYTAIHEVFHIIYERHHQIIRPSDVRSLADIRTLFSTMLQNEGFAVYAPLKLRQQRGHMGSTLHRIVEDYVVLNAPDKMQEHIERFEQVLQLFEKPASQPLDVGYYMEQIFGPERFTYRIGCEIIRRIEATHGYAAVQQAVFMPAADFAQRYIPLLFE